VQLPLVVYNHSQLTASGPRPTATGSMVQHWSGIHKRGRCHFWRRESLSFMYAELFALRSFLLQVEAWTDVSVAGSDGARTTTHFFRRRAATPHMPHHRNIETISPSDIYFLPRLRRKQTTDYLASPCRVHQFLPLSCENYVTQKYMVHKVICTLHSPSIISSTFPSPQVIAFRASLIANIYMRHPPQPGPRVFQHPRQLQY
jgi:hypothetical protein